MTDLVIVALQDEATAFQLRADLVKLQKDYLIEMEDVVVVTREGDGQVKLHQSVNLTTSGAVGGTFWGALVGLLFLNPIVGAAVGAARARWPASSRYRDRGCLPEKRGRKLEPGRAAVGVLIRR